MSERIDRFIEEISGVRNAVEELYLVLEHIWRNREELTGILNLDRLPDRSTKYPHVPESISCSVCDAMADSLQEAVQDGWTEFIRDDGRSWNFLGRCPSCIEEERAECAVRPTESSNAAVPQRPASAEADSPLPNAQKDLF